MAIDIETTGLDPRRHEVISFAALPIEQGRILAGGAVRGLVRPESPPPRTAVEINGLRSPDLAAAPAAPDALAPLAGALARGIPVAHVAWVERSFLGPHLRRLGHRFPLRVIDTALLWRLLSIQRGEGDPGQRPLSDIAARLGLPSHRPHVAEGDALTMAQAFLALATHLEELGSGSLRALTGAHWQLRGWQLWHPREVRCSG